MRGVATTSGMAIYDSKDTSTGNLFLFESYTSVVILELLTGKFRAKRGDV
jgi:hypothetical protein